MSLQRSLRASLAIGFVLLSPTSALLSWDCGAHDARTEYSNSSFDPISTGPSTGPSSIEDQWATTAFESFFIDLTEYSLTWMIIIGCFFGFGLFTLPCAIYCKDKGMSKLFIFLATSYCGIVYLLYPVTILLAGFPKNWNWVYPEAPHVSPEKSEAASPQIFLRFVLNGLILVTAFIWISYMTAIILGIFITFAVSFIVLGLVISVARMADYANEYAQEEPQGEVQSAGGKGQTADTGGAGGGAAGGAPTVPSGGGDASTCQACCGGVCVLLYCCMGALRTVFNMFFDLLLLVSVGFTWPSLGLPDMDMDFEFGYGIDVAFPCIRVPQVRLRCRFLSTTIQLAMLAAMTIPIFVIISSDLMVMLHDRILRGASSKLSLFKKEERWRALRALVFSQVIAQCQFVCWKVVEIIAANGAAAFVEVFFHVFEMDASETCHPFLNVLSKVLAVWFALVIFARVFALASGRGIYSDMVYIMAVSLTQSDIPLFTKVSLVNIVSMVRITIGSAILPGLHKLGLNHHEMPTIQSKLDKYGAGEKFDLDRAFKDFNSMINTDRRKNGPIDNTLLSYRKAFSAEVSMLAALAMCRQHDKVKHRNLKAKLTAGLHVDILDVGATSVDDFLQGQQHTKALRAQYQKRWVDGCRNSTMPFSLVVGRYKERELAQLRVLGRAQLWQSQIEAVQMASGNALGVCLQMIPFVGIFIGKATMYLNEYPTWIYTTDAEFGTRSLRWKRSGEAAENGPYPDDRDGVLKASPRLKKLYACSVLKIVLLFTAYFARQPIPCMAGAFVIALLEVFISRSEEPQQIERAAKPVIKIAARPSAVASTQAWDEPKQPNTST